jgi:hypothetical protein
MLRPPVTMHCSSGSSARLDSSTGPVCSTRTQPRSKGSHRRTHPSSPALASRASGSSSPPAGSAPAAAGRQARAARFWHSARGRSRDGQVAAAAAWPTHLLPPPAPQLLLARSGQVAAPAGQPAPAPAPEGRLQGPARARQRRPNEALQPAWPYWQAPACQRHTGRPQSRCRLLAGWAMGRAAGPPCGCGASRAPACDAQRSSCAAPRRLRHGPAAAALLGLGLAS